MCSSTPQVVKQFDVTDPSSNIRKAGRDLDPTDPGSKLRKTTKALGITDQDSTAGIPAKLPEAQVMPDMSTMMQTKRKRRTDTFLTSDAESRQKTLLGE